MAKGERWHSGVRQFAKNPKVDRFLAEVVEVCRKHGFSIEHQDHHGGFIVVPLNEPAVEWLQAASVDVKSGL